MHVPLLPDGPFPRCSAKSHLQVHAGAVILVEAVSSSHSLLSTMWCAGFLARAALDTTRRHPCFWVAFPKDALNQGCMTATLSARHQNMQGASFGG